MFDGVNDKNYDQGILAKQWLHFHIMYKSCRTKWDNKPKHLIVFIYEIISRGINLCVNCVAFEPLKIS